MDACIICFRDASYVLFEALNRIGDRKTVYSCPNCQQKTISTGSKLRVGRPIIDGITPERTTVCSNCQAHIGIAGKNHLWMWYLIVALSVLFCLMFTKIPLGSDSVRIMIGLVIGLVLSSGLFVHQLRRTLVLKNNPTTRTNV